MKFASVSPPVWMAQNNSEGYKIWENGTYMLSIHGSPKQCRLHCGSRITITDPVEILTELRDCDLPEEAAQELRDMI